MGRACETDDLHLPASVELYILLTEKHFFSAGHIVRFFVIFETAQSRLQGAIRSDCLEISSKSPHLPWCALPAFIRHTCRHCMQYMYGGSMCVLSLESFP